MLITNNQETYRKCLTLHAKQGEVFRDSHRFKVIVAGRRWGKSTYSGIEIIKSARLPNQYIWYVAPTYKMAKTIMWRRLLDWIPRQWIKKTNDTMTTILLVNNSLIELKGCDKKDNLRGVGLNKVILDEAQDIEDDVWYKVLRPTLADKMGEAVIIGSPKGFTFLYDVYMLGQRGEYYQVGEKVRRNMWKSWQFPTITSPFVPESEIEQAKHDMDWKSFSQEFMASHLYETEVVLFNGVVKQIQDVVVGDQLNHVTDSGLIVPCNVLKVCPTGQKKIIDVRLETGEIVTASERHHFKSTENGVSKRIQLNNLKVVDKYPVVNGKLIVNKDELLAWQYHQYQKCSTNVTFDEWIQNRWLENNGCMSLYVVEQIERDIEPTMNLLVDSPDHSYLLASGINNYNSFESMSGRVYYAFERSTHIKMCKFNPDLPIWIGQDFNIDPMSSIIMQPQANGNVHVVDEIILPNSNVEEAAQEIQRRYWRYIDNITMYPDPSGGSRQHARGESSLQIMRENGLRVQKYRRKAPYITDRTNAVNRMFRAADGSVRAYVDPKCKHLIKGLEQLIYKEGTPDIDKSGGHDHACDAFGYAIEIEYSMRKVSTIGVSI